MNIKIFSRSIPVESNDDDSFAFGDKAFSSIKSMEEELATFLIDKKDVKIKWCQSVGSMSKMLFGSKPNPFIQLTAIVQW